MRQTFSIQAWSALAGSLATAPQWQSWAAAPVLPPAVPDEVALPTFPAMARRRLGPLGKMAVWVADAALAQCGADVPSMPVVWASRYGDAQRSLDLLAEQALGEPLSPTAFGLSVHNGIAAQHSIARQVRANGVCVAAGQHTAEAGVMQALGLLADGAPQVLLVCYDAPLPGAYAQFHDEPLCAFAWAWVLCAGPAPGTRMRLSIPAPDLAHPGGPALSATVAHLPHGLQVLHSMLSGTNLFCAPWRWEHVHA